MAVERRRVEGYRLHRDNYVRLLEYVKANIQVLSAETQAIIEIEMEIRP